MKSGHSSNEAQHLDFIMIFLSQLYKSWKITFLILPLSYTLLTVQVQIKTSGIYLKFIFLFSCRYSTLLINQWKAQHSLSEKKETSIFDSKPHFGLDDLIYWGSCSNISIIHQSIKPKPPQIPKHFYLCNT